MIPSGGPVRAVLEVIGGTARKLGIAPGDRVAHPMFGGLERARIARSTRAAMLPALGLSARPTLGSDAKRQLAGRGRTVYRGRRRATGA